MLSNTLLITLSKQRPGTVSLVGAGPGDPELLTLKAYQRLMSADIVLHDRLVSTEILDMLPPTTRLYYVGKARAHHSLAQDDINQALLEWALAGHRVVRLKGGDPFIFGRGGEELEALVSQGIEVEVIPGITAASGCATYAGIPLTHRDHAQSLRLVTGHLQDDHPPDWTSLARPGQTLVFYMGLANLPEMAKALIAHGMKEDMPVALISQGTTASQGVFTGTLGRLPAAYREGLVVSPTLIIVGSVVSLRTEPDGFVQTKSSAKSSVKSSASGVGDSICALRQVS